MVFIFYKALSPFEQIKINTSFSGRDSTNKGSDFWCIEKWVGRRRRRLNSGKY